MNMLYALPLVVLVAACDVPPDVGTSPSPVQSIASTTPVTALRSSDRDPLGSSLAQCANDQPIMTQANSRGGNVLFEFQIGYGTSQAELWVFKRRNERGHPEVYILAHKLPVGDGVRETFKASYQTNDITEDGHYYVIVRRLKCGDNIMMLGEFSEKKEFTIGTPDASAPETCEEQWAKIPGADPVGRCDALRRS
jgi:hypothetical protein